MKTVENNIEKRNKKGQFLKGFKPWNTGLKGKYKTGRANFVAYGKDNPFYGKKHSKETKKKMSLLKKGKPSPRKGVKLSQETKTKLSLAHKGKQSSRLGVNLSFKLRKKMSILKLGIKEEEWSGFSLNRTERKRLMARKDYIIWRTAVLIRDDYTCQMCREKKVKFQVDHIKPWSLFPELRYAIDNGRTLCVECHRQTDTYGYRSKKLLVNENIGA